MRPAEDLNVANNLWHRARVSPDLPAIFEGQDLIATYGEWAAHAEQLACHLERDLGIDPGERVGIYLANQPSYLILFYAIWWAGAVAVPINAKLHASELAWIAEDSRLRLLVTQTGTVLSERSGPEFREIAVDDIISRAHPGAGARPNHAPVPRAGDDLAWLFYTSGTTGRPKGAMLGHRNLAVMTAAFAQDVDQVGADDQVLYAAPMSHGAGLYNFSYVRGGAGHVVPKSRGFRADETIALAKAHGNIGMFAAPTIVQRLVEQARAHGYRGDGLKTIIYGGGPMLLSHLDEAVDQLGARFVQIYGQGECPMTITALPRSVIADRDHPAADRRRASVGIAQAGVSVAVVDQNFAALPPGEIGEIVVGGDVVMQGYWNNPGATRSALEGGWLRTGDLGWFDVDGFLTLSDRSKDVIISGGTNIYPREVEEVLIAHPSVRDVSVFGIPDHKWGESVAVAIVAAADSTPSQAELDAWVRSRIAAFKRPRTYMFFDELPKNAYGKIVKRALQDHVSAMVAGAAKTSEPAHD